MGTPPRPSNGDVPWTFLSNHAHVLLCIARSPEIRLREVAVQVGITERAVQRIVAELEEGGYLTRERDGRRNRYIIHADRPLRHPNESHRKVRVLLDGVLDLDEESSRRSAPPGRGRRERDGRAVRERGPRSAGTTTEKAGG